MYSLVLVEISIKEQSIYFEQYNTCLSHTTIIMSNPFE